jgi:hypothetical protein
VAKKRGQHKKWYQHYLSILVRLSKHVTTYNLDCINLHTPNFLDLKLRWIRTLWSHSHWAWTNYLMALLFPILSEIPKVFTSKESHLLQDLRHQKINEFQSQPMSNELLPIPKCQPRHSLPQYHNSHLTLHKSSNFCITFTTSLWHKLLCSTLSFQRSEIAKNNNMHKEYSFILHFNLHQHYLPTNKNPNIKYLALLPSFVHHPPLLNRATILQKIATLHPSTIPSTNWNLDIMKNRHQNHTSSKLFLQTRCPQSPLSMNVDLVNIKQNKQTYTISNNTWSACS